MFYALATLEESYLADNLFTFAALAPCTIQVSEGDSTLYLPHGLFQFEDYGVYSLDGPHWHHNLKVIEENFSQEVYEYAAGYTGSEPPSVRTDMHWAQC